MVGKNNNYVRESKSNEHFQRFALRKLSVGVVSVAVAAGFYLGSGTTAQAATAESDASAKTEQVVQQDANSTASDSTSASNSSAAVSASSAAPVSAEPASKVAASDSPASASSASDSQASAANASESSSQPASSSVASDAAATVSEDSQATSEANSQSAADVETAQLPTSATSANESQLANILSAQAVQKVANQQAPAGFTVTDPTYPAEMYQDTKHYTYWWAQSSDGKYNLVLSTDRNGDGKVYVFLLGSNNEVLGKYTVDKNKSTEIATDDEGGFGTVYNDGQSGVFVASDGTWKSKFNVFNPQAGKDNGNYNSLSFMIPQVETQTTTYVDGNGKQVSDPITQKGLDGQIYTTQGGQVIPGYFAKEPSNANGYMSPFGKQGATYTKDWHDGLKATFTETDAKTGLMHVVVEYYGKEITDFYLAYGQSKLVKYSYYDYSYDLVTTAVTIHSIYIPQTINIQYTYEKLGNLVISSDSKSFPAEDKTTTQYPNDESDSTKAGNVTIPKVAGFTPTIDGKTVTNYTFNPSDYVSDLSKDINVVYVADTQEAQALFYDETTGQLIDGTRQVATGKTGEAISFTKNPSEIVKELEAKGYVFDKDNAKNKVFTTGTTYDNDSTAHQYFKYYFTHAKTIVTPDNPKTPADVLPDNPGKNYPSGVAKDDLNKTVTRTINIKTPDGKTQTTTQKAEFTRSATVDEVTGEVTYGSWSNNVVLGSADVPNIPGYTPSTSVPEITVTPNDKDMTINVTYQADQQFAHTVYLDADENNAHVPSTPGGSLPDKTVIQNVEIKGVTGGKIDYAFDAAHDQNYAAISNYYNLKSVDVPSTFDNDDDIDQIVYVYLTHRTEDVSNTDPQAKTTATRTINVTMPDGKTSSETQTVNYKRTATKDLVNGHITYGQWQADGASAWEEYTPTPQKGYTTLINGVAGTKVAQKTPSFKDDKPVNETVNVTYQADVQRAVIKYIDGETSENLQKTDDIVDGHTNETINYSTADKIKEFVGKGYELVSNDFKPGTKFDNDDKTDQTYTVIFKHHRENVDPNHSSADGTKGTKTLTETVRYKYANGAKAAEDQTAQVTFTRNGVLDDVTGIVAWGKWNEASQSYKALTSPTIAGYTPSEAVVKRSSNSDAEQGPTVTVIYTADAQKVHVQYIDGETDKLLRQDDLDGYTDETIPYSTAEGIKKFEGDGYELFKDNFPAGEKFDNDDKTDQTYTVIFKHHRENVDPNHSSADGTKGTKTLTETVHYKYADGTKAAEDQTAQVTFTRNGVLDDVTGIVAWGKWNEASQSYKALTSPTIAGYTPSEAVVKRSSNSDAEQGPTLTVIYTADAQKVHVQYIDGETDKLLRQDDLDGYTDETIPYSTAEGIKKFEGDGYELFKDNFPAGEKFDNDDKADQTYTVIFKHHRENVDPTHSSADGTKGTKTLTETVHYKYADGTKAAEDQTAQVTFTRNGVLDDVTGIVAWGKWNEASQSYKALTSPTIAGYTPSEAVVKRSSNSDAEQGPTLTVIYTADAQTAYVKYVDDTTGETLRQDDLHGYTDETIPYSTAEGIKKFEGDGYVLVSDGFKPGTKFGVGTPTYEVHFKHGTTHTDATDKNAEQKIVTETIHYVYENNQTAKPDYTSAVDFKRGYTTDKVTRKIVSYDPWTVSSKKFGVVKSPAIEGYTPNRKQIDEITVTPDSKDVVKTVVYVGNAQEAQAIFYDETTGKEIANTREIATGKTDETISFAKDPNEVVKELEAKGYVFDKDNANNNVFVAGTAYDKNSEVHQYFKYYLKHGHAAVTPDQDSQNGQTTVTQTIKYQYADGTATGLADNVQTLTFKRTGDEDLVTGKVTWPDWSTVAGQQTSAVTSPTLKGYTADTSEIPAATYHAGDSDVIYVVKYSADAQRAVIKYIDGETGKDLQDPDTVDGHTNETINYSTADKIKEFVGKGYELVSNDFKPGTKFDNDDKTDQTYTVIFKHHRENVDPNHSSADGTKGTKTLTETVHYKYANGAKAAEDQTAQVTFTRNGVLDDVTGIVAWGKWNEASQSYKSLTSPTIAGYTPSEAVVKRSSNSDAEQGPTLTVIYTADAQKVHVQYIDGETDKLLRQDDLDGYTDETIPYSTAEGIKKFEGDGYELFKDNFPAGEKFDNDDANDQTYTVVFKHHRENVDPNHSSADGTKGTKTLTETVHYKYADGTTAAKDQTAQVTFTRNGVLDDVTGIVAWGKWNEASQSYKDLTSPTIAGYTPSEAVVKRSSNSDAEQGPTVTVIYTADAQKVHVQYIDGETDKLLRQDDLDGYTDETIPYSTAEGIKKFEGDGYELFKDNFPAGEKFDNDDANDQFYTVVFKHHRENVDPNHSSADGTKGTKTLTETVHYKYADGTKAAEDQTAQVTFTRNGVLDDVTGIVAWGKWNEASQSYKALTSPTIAGYTPSEAVVKRSSNSDAEQGPTVTVIYTADAQTAYVKYIDDTTGETLRQDDLHGYTDETIPYSTAEGIKKFEGDGYVLVSDGFKPGTKFGVGTPTYEVHFKHGTTHTSATDENADQKTVTETIHYVDENNQTVQPDYTAAVTFKRGYTTDNVTGKVVSYDPWTIDGKQADSKTFAAVTSPAVEGYTPNHQQINEFTVTPDSKDIVKTVVYVGDPQEAQAIFYDETTGKEISNTREFATGKTDETISFTKDPNEVVKELEKQGYVFDKDNANNNVFVAGTIYDKNSEVHQYFKYYFTHATTTVTPDNPKTPADVLPDNPGKNYPSGVAKDDLNKTVTRTINITTPDGKTQTITQKAEFTRSATVDEVTGEVTYGPWSKNVVLESVDVPNIPGYEPSASVPEITVTPNDQDMTINITYKKLDSGKAADQGGNASNGGQSTTGQAAQNGQSGQTQTNAGAQQLPQTGNANNEKGALGLAGAMFAAGLGLGFGSKKKRHEN
ncbi:mucin-binding protein [Limosilactobacillus mucosae]|nr:YSIRK-type signal peptide-containing protein [Limosilactobacillus mucosae]MDC2843143.1 YSIRK-type signal peptide-containing protein [Limosilactobacillus mucosae]